MNMPVSTTRVTGGWKSRRGERESEHGNATPAKEDRYHYHHDLKAGENTLGANLIRVFMRSVVGAGALPAGRVPVGARLNT